MSVDYIDYTLAYHGRFSSGGDDGRSGGGDDGRSGGGDDGRSGGGDGGLNVQMHCWLEQALWLLELMQLSLQVRL